MKNRITHPNEIQLSVITPMYNEEEEIQESTLKLIQAMEKINDEWELILVNDGSTDKTLELISEIGKKDPRVRIISYKKNRGRGYALREGFKNSLGKYVITVESDLNYGTDIISKLYDALLDPEADIVIASPYAKGGKLINVSLKRAFLSRFGNWILKMTISSNISTFTGMTRGYKGDLVRSLPLEEDGKELHLEIISKTNILGYQITEIPATLKWTSARKGKPKRKSKFKAWKIIRSHLLFASNEAPIFLFGSFGSIILLTGLILGLYLFYLYFIKGEIIGDRIILIMSTIFLVLSGFSIFLFCFISYQIKDLRKEILKMQHKKS